MSQDAIQSQLTKIKNNGHENQMYVYKWHESTYTYKIKK